MPGTLVACAAPHDGNQMAEMSRRHRPQRQSDRMRTAHSALLGTEAADLLDRVQDVVCETTRAQMLRALAATTLNVTELSRVVDRTKWTTSRHLRRLRANDLVTARRQGREVLYTLASGPTVDAALAALDVFERRSRDAR